MESPIENLKKIFLPTADSSHDLPKFRCEYCKHEFCGNLHHFKLHILRKHKDVALNLGLSSLEDNENEE